MSATESIHVFARPKSVATEAASLKPAEVLHAFDDDPFVADYEATADARAALGIAELVSLNVDVQAVVPIVLGAVGRMRLLRAELVDQLRRFDIERFDALPRLTQALAYAHWLYLSASAPPQELPRLFARAVELREILLLDIMGLMKRGLVLGVPLTELKGVVGYANVASDLRVLTNIYQANWNVVAGKTAVQATELDEAASLFRQMTQGIAERRQKPDVIATAANERQRAFTFVIRAYEDARAAVAFVRRTEGDADKFAPSIWSRQKRRKVAQVVAGAVSGAGGGPVVGG